MLRVGHEVRAMLWRMLALSLVLEGMLVPAVLYWPTFTKNITKLRGLTPLPVLKQVLDDLGEGGIFAYVIGQHLFKGGTMVGTCAAVLFAMGAVAGEAQRGTLELWLARPVSRARLLVERYLSGALALFVPLLVTTLSIPWLLTFVDAEASLKPMLMAAFHEWVFLMAIFSATFCASCFGRRPLAIGMLFMFVAILEFALYLVERATHYSLLRLSDMPVFLEIQRTGRFDWSLLLPLAAISVVLFSVSLVAFKRRVP